MIVALRKIETLLGQISPKGKRLVLQWVINDLGGNFIIVDKITGIFGAKVRIAQT